MAVTIADVFAPAKTFSDFGSIVSVIVKNAVVLAGIISLFLLILGGFGVIVGAGSGDTKKLEQSKKAVTGAVVGLLVGGTGKLRGLALLWGYSLIPTVIWFFVTSLLYIVLPPPRTSSVQGVLFSIFFLVFSITLFFWKATITYLTLRFGLRLDLSRILVVLVVTIPLLVLYSIGMFRLGIFRIPFI